MNAVTPPARHHTRLPAESPMSANPATLDRGAIADAIRRKQAQIAALEAALAAASEQAAAKHKGPGVRLDDRATWDAAMWRRYIAAAAELEPDYGPRILRLYRQVDQLTGLHDLPMAA